MTPTTARVIKALVAGSALLGSLAIGLAPAGAEPNAGDLDVTFNGTGVAETTIVGNLSADAIARTPDGRLLVVARGTIWRFSADGTLDTSFGGNGLVEGGIADGLSPRRIAALPDGRFVVAGNVPVPGGLTIGAARFLADGTVDPTFLGRDSDGDGVPDQIPVFPPGTFDLSSSVIDLVVQSTGHVVVLGLDANQIVSRNPAAGRISPDGVAGEVRVINPPTTVDTDFASFDAGISPGDRVVLAMGGAAENPNNVVVMARLQADLDLDPSFGGDGFDVLPDPNAEVAANGNFAMTTLADGTAAAIASQGGRNGVFLLRWDRTGRFLGRTAVGFADAVNQAFAGSLLSAGNNGFIAALTLLDSDLNPGTRVMAAVRFDAAGREVGRTVVERPGSRLTAVAATADPGGVVIAGDIEATEGKQLMLARVTAQPQPDPVFGLGGLAIFTGGDSATGESVAVAPDGGAIAAGDLDTFEDDNSFVLRHDPDGRLDLDFGGNVLTAPGSSKPGVVLFDHATHGVTVDAQGRILAVGEDFDGDDGEFGTVTRLLPDGTLDPSFGFEGEVRILAPEDGIRLNAATVDAEGRIVVVGTSDDLQASLGRVFSLLVMRLMPDGQFDRDFNQGNPMVLPLERLAGEGRAVAVQPDGRIVVVGSLGETALEESCCSTMVIARLDENGSFDETFNTGGETEGLRFENIGDGVNRGTGVAVRPDGRIVVAGFTAEITETEPPGATGPPTALVVQLLPDGERDPSFGDDGLFTTEGRVSAVVGGLVIDAEGNTVVAGSGGQISDPEPPPAPPPPPPEADDVVLVRVTPAGSFDAGFGDNGVVWTDLGGVEAAAGVAIDPGGRIVVGGTNRDERGSRVLAARYHSVTALEEPPPPPEEPQEPEPPAPPPTVFTPSVSFNPGVGRAGQTTTATGTGFPPGATITFDWSQGIDAVAPVTAGADGSFTVDVLVLPSEIFGNRLLTAATTDPATGAPLTATAPYLVAIGTSQPGDFVGRR